ncbi:FKBP12-associated protein [Cadophora gregata]|uniref:FKBP12-associated protein n=1 Tax=Cadophora gregata TaxID=51156 RepID=UPI0026DD774B|nr:FKBP12-associated protein [Cadophora gregata]KAK0099586.1 FKBP12-associated protein [Cadophora gregata f. sp. sojae]KAK0116503.1 FKBP12-associated protein [Cadophora gregata]
MTLFSYFTRNLSSRFNLNGGNGQELEDRNAGSNQSARSQQIITDITEGNAPCSICTDSVGFGYDTPYNIWHCKVCYNVYHYHCAKAWETQNISGGHFSLSGVPTWKCPTCSSLQTAIPGPRCWCGRQEHHLSAAGRPNACDNVCARAGACAHNTRKRCAERCHPGPCRYPCTNECPQGPIAPPRPPTAWDRFCKRVHERRSGTLKIMAWGWTVVAIVYGLLGALLHFHIRWHTMPYTYPNFNNLYETFGLLLGLTFVYAPLMGYFLLALFRVTAEFLDSALNLKTASRRLMYKTFVRFFGGILLAAFFGLVLLLPAIGFARGPGIGWYNQMKDSCNGFDTRIVMDRKPGVPATAFALENIHANPDDNYLGLFLGTHLKPTPESRNSTFQYYNRLSGMVAGQVFAVDVDIENEVWRFLHLNGSDKVNSWLAHYSKGLYSNGDLRKVPKFIFPNETILSKGTFSLPRADKPHMEIPQLDMVIMDMYDFLSNPDIEPFLRVLTYRGFEMADAEQMRVEYAIGGKQSSKNVWTKKPHIQEVMRTAAFGYGRKSLTMCVREYVGYHNMEPVAPELPGMQPAELIPFAIISAMRQRYTETGKRREWYYGR